MQQDVLARRHGKRRQSAKHLKSRALVNSGLAGDSKDGNESMIVSQSLGQSQRIIPNTVMAPGKVRHNLQDDPFNAHVRSHAYGRDAIDK